jgi:hypothetical protein
LTAGGCLDVDTGEIDGATVELARHGVGVRCQPDPEVVVEHGVELRGQEAHLGRQLRDLLADELRSDGHLGVEEHDGLGPEQAVLRAAEADGVDAGVDRERPQGLGRAAERGGGVGDPGAVEVHEHPERVRLVAQRGDLVGAVEGSEFGRLGDRHDPGLDVVLDAAAPATSTSCSGTSLAPGDSRSISLVASTRSGAPVSSTAMWAQSVQTMPWWPPGSDDISVASAMTLAPVPLNASRVVTSVPNRSRKRASHSRVWSSSP